MMSKAFLLLIGLSLLLPAASAQDGETCYSDAIEEIHALLNDEASLEEIAKTAASLASECERASRGGILYNVSANSTVNLRAGAGTAHDIVGRTTAGQTFEVYSETEGEQYTWLEIRYADEVAYIAKSLTTRLPDVMLEENQDWVELESIPCSVRHSTRRDSRTTVQVVEYDGRSAEIDVTRLSDNAVMRLLRSDYDAQTDGTYYRYGWQSSGSYILTISHEEGEESIGFQVDGVKTHFLAISCE